MARKNPKNVAAEVETTDESGAEVETTDKVNLDELGEVAAEAEAEATAETEGDAEAEKKFIGQYSPEEWEAMSPVDKVQFMKDKAKAASQKSSGRTVPSPKADRPTIGSVACEAIREGLTNDEVLVRVYEQFPRARTSIASVTWYRNSLKAAGENIMNSRDIKAKRIAEAKAESGDAETENPVDEAADAVDEAEETGTLSEDELAALVG